MTSNAGVERHAPETDCGSEEARVRSNDLLAVRGKRMALNLRPITFAESKEFILLHHRHHGVPQGWLWGHGVEDDNGQLVGVATVGRPVARRLDDGYTCEVTRLCTDGTPNACSILYAAARRAAEAKGFRRILTYILADEDGASLRASGWQYLGDTPGKSWSVPSRPRDDKHPICPKLKYGWGAWRELTSNAGGKAPQPEQ